MTNRTCPRCLNVVMWASDDYYSSLGQRWHGKCYLLHKREVEEEKAKAKRRRMRRLRRYIAFLWSL